MIARTMLALALFGAVTGVDGAVQRAVQEARRPALEPTMRFATGVGHPAVVFGALLGIAVFTGPAGPASARLALLALAPTNLAVEGLKLAVNRTRPDGERKRTNSSFPSSHAANAAALAAVLAWRWRRGAPAFWGAALLVAFSRVYLNRHWPSDVVIGLLIGAACATWAIRRAGDRRPGGAPGQG